MDRKKESCIYIGSWLLFGLFLFLVLCTGNNPNIRKENFRREAARFSGKSISDAAELEKHLRPHIWICKSKLSKRGRGNFQAVFVSNTTRERLVVKFFYSKSGSWEELLPEDKVKFVLVAENDPYSIWDILVPQRIY